MISSKSTLHTFLMNSFISHLLIFNHEEIMAKRVNLHQNHVMDSNQNKNDHLTLIDHLHGLVETVFTDIQKPKRNHKPISSHNGQFTFQRRWAQFLHQSLPLAMDQSAIRSIARNPFHQLVLRCKWQHKFQSQFSKLMSLIWQQNWNKSACQILILSLLTIVLLQQPIRCQPIRSIHVTSQSKMIS